MEPINIAFIIAGVIAFKIPGRAYRLVIATWQLYKVKTVFHYLEYSYRGGNYHTRRSGPLNDLEGIGLKCEVKSRGGVIKVHISGTRDFVQQYINTRQEEINERGGNVFESSN